MKEFAIVIDCFKLTYDELKSYLLSINGIVGVTIIDIDDLLRLKIKYDYNLISYKIIYFEILAFLNMLDNPMIYEFDKHSNEELKIYEREINSICCEYCYFSFILELFNTDGIIKVTSNFYSKHFKNGYAKDKYKVFISYDPKIINLEKLVKLTDNLEE